MPRGRGEGKQGNKSVSGVGDGVRNNDRGTSGQCFQPCIDQRLRCSNIKQEKIKENTGDLISSKKQVAFNWFARENNHINY